MDLSLMFPQSFFFHIRKGCSFILSSFLSFSIFNKSAVYHHYLLSLCSPLINAYPAELIDDSDQWDWACHCYSWNGQRGHWKAKWNSIFLSRSSMSFLFYDRYPTRNFLPELLWYVDAATLYSAERISHVLGFFSILLSFLAGNFGDIISKKYAVRNRMTKQLMKSTIGILNLLLKDNYKITHAYN